MHIDNYSDPGENESNKYGHQVGGCMEVHYEAFIVLIVASAIYLAAMFIINRRGKYRKV